jgi:hypothetical protein
MNQAAFYLLRGTAGRLRVPLRVIRTNKRSVGLGISFSAMMGLVALVLLAQHKPSWYQPVPLSDAALEQARLNATAKWDEISGRIVAGRPFDVWLSQAEANDWFAALAHDRPELLASLPAELSALALGFVEGELKIGALAESNGWRAIVSASLVPVLSADRRHGTLISTGGSLGSLPASESMVERFTGRMLHKQSAALNENGEAKLIGQVARWAADGYRFENYFVWPNGDRPFRIDSIEIGEGTLCLGLHPL